MCMRSPFIWLDRQLSSVRRVIPDHRYGMHFYTIFLKDTGLDQMLQ